jgi:hypothetical protein
MIGAARLSDTGVGIDGRHMSGRPGSSFIAAVLMETLMRE